MKINEKEWYPCYLNPDFSEIKELAESKWDTCRILTDGDNLIIASGLGNTHTSIAQRYRIALGRKRAPQTDSYILYHKDRIAYFNLEDISGSQHARYDTWSKYFNDSHVELLKDLIRESDLAL